MSKMLLANVWTDVTTETRVMSVLRDLLSIGWCAGEHKIDKLHGYYKQVLDDGVSNTEPDLGGREWKVLSRAKL